MRISRPVAIAVAASACLVAVQVFAKPPAGHGLPSRIQRGMQIAPVELNLEGKDPGQVYLGSYLVNAVGACNDCHTNPPYTDNPFAGDPGVVNAANYLAGGRAFGPFVSANITPDENGNPAGLTRDEFLQVIRSGHEIQGDGILQVMPWPVFRNMTSRDLNAIYTYLTAIPHAEPQQ